MDTDSTYLALYVLTKLFAYTIWCFLGAKLLSSSERKLNLPSMAEGVTISRKKWVLAVGYGFLRVLIGLTFGYLILLLGTILTTNIWNGPHSDVITYLVVYIPVRWMEWTILAWIMARNSVASIDYGWRFGGIAISCLADIPLIAAMDWTLPLGHFC